MTNPGGAPYSVDFAEVERLARQHDVNAEDVVKWATGDPDFAEKYLQTHGAVNFASYLAIGEHFAQRLSAGGQFAGGQIQTAAALRGTVAATQQTDADSATPFRAVTTA